MFRRITSLRSIEDRWESCPVSAPILPISISHTGRTRPWTELLIQMMLVGTIAWHPVGTTAFARKVLEDFAAK